MSKLSIYALKPRFQAFLRPAAAALARGGVTANQVTLAAAAVSIALGAALTLRAPEGRGAFLLVPLWMIVRMAMNALDGMLAREFGQRSRLGACLNELGDVLADAALYAPFALIAPFAPPWVAAVIVLAVASELAGLLGPLIGASRRYDGPMGKSDRAFVFGALGLWIGVSPGLPDALAWLMPILAALLALTIVNRVRGALAETAGTSA